MKISEFEYPNEKILQQIIDLGDQNSKTLGFFPRGAFDNNAKDGNIIISLGENGDLVGYLLYGIVNRRLIWPKVKIVHLCVKEKYRGTGAARRLIGYLEEKFKDQCSDIQLSCRVDYEENKVWPKFGFQKVRIKRGRKLEGSELQIWRKELRKLPLFEQLDSLKEDTVLPIVVDNNILIRFCNTMPPTSKHDEMLVQEAKALQSDWISEEINIYKTEESKLEISRQTDPTIKINRLVEVNKYPNVSTQPLEVKKIYDELKKLFPDIVKETDKSDLKQVAHTIAGGIKYFITQDRTLHKRGEKINEKYDVQVLFPAELISKLDELQSEQEYYPRRFAGTRKLKISRLRNEQISTLYEDFKDNENGEKKAYFSRKIRSYLSNPDAEISIISMSENENVGLFCYIKSTDGLLDIPLLRIKKETYKGTIIRAVLKHIIDDCVEKGIQIIRISEDCILHDAAFIELGFTKDSKSNWTKLIVQGIFDRNELILHLTKLHEKQLEQELIGEFQLLLKKNELSKMDFLDIENRLSPVKISDLELPVYVIPIHPKWAYDLFDENLARQTLWGANSEIMLSLENVYYTKTPTKIKFPSRVLWYVTSSDEFQGAKNIVAYSLISEVVYGEAKKLFNKYKKYGVYKWTNINKITGNNPDKKIKAIKFRSTELLSTSISLDQYKKILFKVENKNIILQTAQEISAETFSMLYNIGIQKNMD